MKAVANRLRRLEHQFVPPLERDFLQNLRGHLRLVVSAMDHCLSLATSKCTRTLCENGVLPEVVDLDGVRDGLSADGLDPLVATFPVQIFGGVRAR